MLQGKKHTCIGLIFKIKRYTYSPCKGKIKLMRLQPCAPFFTLLICTYETIDNLEFG